MAEICKKIVGKPDILINKSVTGKSGCSEKGKVNIRKCIQEWIDAGNIVIPFPEDETGEDTTYTIEEVDGVVTLTDSNGDTAGQFELTETPTEIKVNTNGTFTYTNEDEVDKIVNICDLLKGLPQTGALTDTSQVLTISSEGECGIQKYAYPTRHDITDTITNAFDVNDPVLNCENYGIGDILVIGADSLCPDFAYQILSDGNGGCVTVMIQKPDGATGSTS